MMIKNRRLLASGCSFTDYYWPTWADILGEYFLNYQQVGIGGSDNATVARSIIKHAKPDDLVIVMWTSYDRWSFYVEDGHPMPKDQNNHWRHLGSLPLWDKEFCLKYYHKVERFHTTMDYIKLIDCHKDKVGYEVYHFPAFPLFHAETESTVDPRLLDIYNNSLSDVENNFLTSQLSLKEFRDKKYPLLPKNKPGDTHPLPLCHWAYAEEFIAPKLDISFTSEHKDRIEIIHNNILNGKYESSYN